MTIVNSWNEWDSLKHVIVGRVENSNIPPIEPALAPKISKDSGMIGSHGPRPKDAIDKANIQLGQVSSESFGTPKVTNVTGYNPDADIYTQLSS